jgi:hypothetical protein
MQVSLCILQPTLSLWIEQWVQTLLVQLQPGFQSNSWDLPQVMVSRSVIMCQAVANTTVAFNSTGLSQNPLTVTNPSTGVYEIKGILTIEDYNSAVATVNPPVGYTGNVAYSATFTNTNSAAGNFVLSFVGVP